MVLEATWPYMVPGGERKGGVVLVWFFCGGRKGVARQKGEFAASQQVFDSD